MTSLDKIEKIEVYDDKVYFCTEDECIEKGPTVGRQLVDALIMQGSVELSQIEIMKG